MSWCWASRAVSLTALAMALHPGSTSAQTALSCGDAVSDSINSAESDLYTFEGRAGDELILTLVEDGSWPPLAAPGAWVFAPDGTPLRGIVEDSFYGRLLSSDEPILQDVSVAQASSSILSGTDLTPSGRLLHAAFGGDFPGETRVAEALDAEFGAPGSNSLYYNSSTGLASPLVPLFQDPGDTDEGAVTSGGIDRLLTPQQEALLGCGALHLTDCDFDGIGLATSETRALLQSFPVDPDWDSADPVLPQPGTVDAAFNDGPGGGVDLGGSKPGEAESDPIDVAGAHYDPLAFTEHLANAARNGIDVDDSVEANLAAYDASVDGSVGCTTETGCRRHPFTGQPFSSEMAILSWNLLMLSVALGSDDNPIVPFWLDRSNPLALGRCSYRQPQHCVLVTHLLLGGRMTLPNDGEYTVQVEVFAGGVLTTGGYLLELACPRGAQGKATVCHKGRKTILVGAEALEPHLAHGDAVGECLE